MDDIFKEKNEKYQGTGWVRLNQLKFSRDFDLDNVNRLKRIFENACKREQFPVSALISKVNLEASEKELAACLRPSDEKKKRVDVELPDNAVLNCLHGRDRIQAAIETWGDNESWPVELYLDDASDDLVSHLKDAYSNEKPPNDGEMFCKLQNHRAKGRWNLYAQLFAQLKDGQRRGVRQLEKNIPILCCFNKLMEIPGLWYGMQLYFVPRLIAMRCEEEVIHYLEHIYKTWLVIVGIHGLERVDERSVRLLESRAPGCSKSDMAEVSKAMTEGDLFRDFAEADRTAIFERTLGMKILIPTLKTFFRDCDYLEAGSKSLWLLFKDKAAYPSLKEAFRRANPESFKLKAKTKIEIAENSFIEVALTSPTEARQCCYKQMWLYAMRNYPALSSLAGENKKLLAKARAEQMPKDIVKLKEIASTLGLHGQREDLQRRADREILRDALLSAWSSDHYEYDIEDLISKIVRIVLQQVKRKKASKSNLTPKFTSPGALDIRRRRGFPQKKSHALDRQFLFITYLESNLNVPGRSANPNVMGKNVSSLFVRRSVYLAFFEETQVPPGFIKTADSESDVVMEEAESDAKVAEKSDTDMQEKESDAGSGIQEAKEYDTDMQEADAETGGAEESQANMQEKESDAEAGILKAEEYNVEANRGSKESKDSNAGKNSKEATESHETESDGGAEIQKAKDYDTDLQEANAETGEAEESHTTMQEKESDADAGIKKAEESIKYKVWFYEGNDWKCQELDQKALQLLSAFEQGERRHVFQTRYREGVLIKELTNKPEEPIIGWTSENEVRCFKWNEKAKKPEILFEEQRKKKEAIFKLGDLPEAEEADIATWAKNSESLVLSEKAQRGERTVFNSEAYRTVFNSDANPLKRKRVSVELTLQNAAYTLKSRKLHHDDTKDEDVDTTEEEL